MAIGLLGMIFFRLGLGERPMLDGTDCGTEKSLRYDDIIGAGVTNEFGPGIPGTNGISLPAWRILVASMELIACECGGRVSGL